MLKRTTMTLAVCAMAALALGCGSSEVVEPEPAVSAAEPAPPPAAAPDQKEHREWKEVWSVEVRGKEVSSRKVGYLVRTFTTEAPEGGNFFVHDLAWDVRGFLLPEGKAFSFDPRTQAPVEAQDLGNTGFESGVKKILKVTGEVQLRPPTAPTTAAAAEPEKK